jgi:hypothetical protein
MNEYEIEIVGIKHTVLLSDEDAKRYGDAATSVTKSEPKAKTPINKSRKPANKASSES